MQERTKRRAVFNWSGGKDSAHALLRALESEEYEIIALLTTINSHTEHSTMHRIPLELLEAQALSIGIPLYTVKLTPNGTMESYNELMLQAVNHFKGQGVEYFIFGDIFLEEILEHRKKNLEPQGIKVVEPLWGSSTEEVMESFLATSIKTVVVTTELSGLGLEAIGRVIDRDFIESLPVGVDINGENGEYHTFCFDAPMFKYPILYSLGTPFTQHFDISTESGEVVRHSYCFAELTAR